MNETLQMVGSNVGWAKHTNLHPVAIALMLVLGVAILAVRRPYAIWPVILLCCFIPSAQRFVVGGADFTLLRVMVLLGWIRVLARSEQAGLKWNILDTLLVGWAAADTIMHTLLFGEVSTLINRLGNCYDSVGLYFLFRCLITNWDDICTTAVGFVVASIPVMGFFVLEHFTGKNVFAVFGSVPYDTIVREGRLRCQGAFAHPILAGCFWACMVPLMAALWFRGGRWRMAAAIGIFCSLVIIVACASSTPIVAVGFAVFGGCCFAVRYYMRLVRWSLLLVLFALHMSMRAPVWHLVSRIDISGGSTGWQRFYLVDQTIRRVGEWWLMGVRTTAFWGDGLIDITNQFVLQAISGGMLTLGLYVAMICIAFRQTGRLWRDERFHRWHMLLAWSLGVSLFVHVSNFLAVSYFGQIEMVWYLCLAMVGSIAARAGIQPAVAPAVRRLVAAPAQAPTARRRRRRPERSLPGAMPELPMTIPPTLDHEQ